MQIVEPNLRFNGSLRNLNNVEYIIIHHTAHPSWGLMDTHMYHRDDLGWAGIGYNYFIHRQAIIYKGRGKKQGAHAGGSYNNRSIGVCVAGNFDSQTPSEEQIEACIWLVRKLKKDYPNAEIIGHNGVSNTACPGRNFPLSRVIEEANKTESKPEPSVTYNGEEIPAFIEDGRSFAQMRTLADLVGASVDWDQDKHVAKLNGNEVDGTIVEGRTFLPVRELGEKLDLNVDWNQEKRQAVLSK
ncbi:N-acetylmuramoyl-L-alanine amidase [Alkalicoccus chagannorensis]|uniref:N-acetylmuramoyl-L-alanine amidase n=1 Tax=Alkalicoccus chagannorensis TaxID=427072 RepID=UPI0004173EEA|nr:N-acetylmuramoyl-L-alanine amidase [Alkalicoccus chagannorensis]